VVHGGHVVGHEWRKAARGSHSFTWTPASPGKYVLTIEAVDQNKNHTSPSFDINVSG
jgi:hypothetical protein